VKEIQKGARATKTVEIYDKKWKDFCLWCQKFGYSIPADNQTILDWIGWAKELEVLYQVNSMLASIALEHKKRNWQDPTTSFHVYEKSQ
jgi:hypothetical protein